MFPDRVTKTSRRSGTKSRTTSSPTQQSAAYKKQLLEATTPVQQREPRGDLLGFLISRGCVDAPKEPISRHPFAYQDGLSSTASVEERDAHVVIRRMEHQRMQQKIRRLEQENQRMHQENQRLQENTERLELNNVTLGMGMININSRHQPAQNRATYKPTFLDTAPKASEDGNPETYTAASATTNTDTSEQHRPKESPNPTSSLPPCFGHSRFISRRHDRHSKGVPDLHRRPWDRADLGRSDCGCGVGEGVEGAAL